MIKFLPHLHNANNNFKKQFLVAPLLLVSALSIQTFTIAQCPQAPVVTPNPAVMCTGGAPIKLTIIPSSNTMSFCSPAVNIPVADNDPMGNSNPVMVSGIPLNVNITAAVVKINMTHTRISDMVFVLKAPNGMVLNLDYRIGATATVAAGTGFTNTNFSSNSIVALSTGTSPYTGIFRPDAITSGTSLGAAGPTGMLPSATTFAQLYSIINGSWTLGFYDAATGETGILNSWCISFSYFPVSGTGATPGVWSPAAGLFMDAAATIPYVAGTPADVVWAWPSPAGTYTYQVITQGLPMAPISFSNPANISIPIGGSASPYPSTVIVAGLPPTGMRVRSVVINGLTHSKSDDLDILLQSPSGQNAILMSDNGGANAINASYTFMDSGLYLNNAVANATGIYRPSNQGSPDNFSAPGPGNIVQTIPSILSSFTGDLNGQWKLFVMDDDGTAGQGSITNGFTINFDTGAICFSPPTTVVITVGTPVVITTAPVNQNICLGSNAHFSVVAAGSGLSYQWQISTNGGATFTNLINGGNYNGVTTANLTVTQPPLSMTGTIFRVIVNSTTACAPASATATLTVNPLPTVSFYPSPYRKLLPGLTTTLNAVVAPNTINAYTWWHDGAVVPGATSSTYLVDFDHIGLYQLSVIDNNGCSNISDTMSIRDSALGIMFMYPNPCNGYFQLRMYSEPNKVVPLVLNVYNNMGTKVLTQSYTQTRSYQQIVVNTTRYGKGIYWVELLDKDDKRISISRILVQ
jgi:subtilisin-like proprotein convertase family protein